jgi:hypothetical protein
MSGTNEAEPSPMPPSEVGVLPGEAHLGGPIGREERMVYAEVVPVKLTPKERAT